MMKTNREGSSRNIDNGILMANIEPISARELDDSGLLRYINDFISIFNICILYDKQNNIIFPAKLKIHESSDRQTSRLISYIKRNSKKR